MIEKNNKQFKIYLTIIIIVLLVFAIGALESLGLFPGSLLNRLALKSYMKKNYPTLSYELEKSYFDKEENLFVYDLTSDDQTFLIKAKSLNVAYDGYFDKYLKDWQMIDQISSVINEDLGSERAVYSFDYPIKKWDYEDPYQVLEELKGSYGLIVEIVGEGLTFDQYKKLAAEYGKGVFDKDYLPAYVQIFYYRYKDMDKILAYESRIIKDFLYYEEDLIERASDTHFRVELDASTEKKVKIYMFFKDFYMIFIFATALILSLVWILKKRNQN